MMKIWYLLLFLLTASPVSNWTGYSLQEQREKEIEQKIKELKQKYPPDDTGWMYEIQNRVNSTC